MYRKGLFILLFFTALSLNSCDRIRGILGMPTSQELDALQNQDRQANNLLDEYLKQEAAQRQMEDSFFDPDVRSEEEKNPATGYRDVYSPANTNQSMNRFHVIVGSFKVPDNAARMVRRLSERGYRPAELIFRNGYMVVSADSFTDMSDAILAMRRMQSTDASLCPYDSYVYDMNQRLHVESASRW